jgi:hypothetical protein
MTLARISAALLASAMGWYAWAADVDPSAWTYNLISTRGKVKLSQTCHGPGACETIAFNNKDKLLWKVAHAVGERETVGIADDGVHVIEVRANLKAGTPADADAVRIYRKGEVAKTWKLNELFDNPRALPSKDDAVVWALSWELVRDARAVRVVVSNGEVLEFEFKTLERRLIKPATPTPVPAHDPAAPAK